MIWKVLKSTITLTFVGILENHGLLLATICDPLKLMLDLLLGARKHRYLGSCLAAPRPTEVYVRGFSAGSYSGICLLHLLWNMPHVQVGGILGGISCPPALIHGISPEHGQNLMLIHLTTDRLCKLASL